MIRPSPRKTADVALDWARERDYAGYDPYDGLNSPVLSSFASNWLTRLVAIHGVNKSPINLRPVLGIEPERNPKGVALFASACLRLYEATGEEAYLTEAEELLRWLAQNTSTVTTRHAWGYNFDWQNARRFFLPAYHPSIVVTVFCARAFLEHHEVTGADWSLDVADDAAAYIREGINVVDVDGFDAYTYTPYGDFVVINANALAAAFFLRLSGHTADGELRSRAVELFEFVLHAQDDTGAWYYSMPASDSHLSHDNFHTGFVLESLSEYVTTFPGDERAREAYDDGMAFFVDELFEADGAPKFESDKSTPYDAHASAQALITLAQSDSLEARETAERVREWTMEHLYDEEGYFYRRVGRVLNDETPYMRWSQGWMTLALSTLVRAEAERDDVEAHAERSAVPAED
ncbi:hypothetical protein [Halogeometricum limi]|uniref:Mannose or cellobiose epimerase, N-acyl-D-glucosamine 2-epimerase family n=1 Tax=Halogeometricum limi TaxID=555875 RepID=A0A1I6IIW5_9EURY|nr:hypothetical protein [Halogeometricum limi]SFR66672.1 hypothetical protein SAMN04488124_3271 [Halogeometricum limi]